MTAISEIQRAHFYIYKKAKTIPKRFYIQKSGHFAKNKTISVTFLYIKSTTLYVTRFFMKILKLAFIYKKHVTLRCVTFYLQKFRHFAKSKTICVIFYMQKSGHFALRDFSLNFLKLAEGGGHFTMQKKCNLCYIFICKK